MRLWIQLEIRQADPKDAFKLWFNYKTFSLIFDLTVESRIRKRVFLMVFKGLNSKQDIQYLDGYIYSYNYKR